MMNDIKCMGEALERIRNVRDEPEFQREVSRIQEYMKRLGMDTHEIFGLEKCAYYLKNEYSDKVTKENMEEARTRVITYIENMLYDAPGDEPLLKILENFYIFLESLIERKPHKGGGIQQEQLKALTIKNEYDVQHLLYACIKLCYPTARTEVNEDTGYGSVRTDIFLDADHVIEVKCTRDNMNLKKLTEEIEADMVHYSAGNIYFFLYDKEKIIENPEVFKETYEKKVQGKRIHIIIHQPKIL